MEYKICRPDELVHWGIKGMRWGIRRYQNADGSLTAAGRKRRDKLEAELKELGGKKRGAKSTATTEPTPRKKRVDEMTDDEVRNAANRMRLEAEYYNAQKNLATVNPPKVSAGKKFMTGLVDDVVVPAAKNTGKVWLEKFMKEKLGLEDIDSKLEKRLKRAKAQYEIADYEKKRLDLAKPKEEKPDWESRNKEDTHISNLYKTEKARRDWNKYQEEIQTLGPDEAWDNYVKRQKQGGN